MTQYRVICVAMILALTSFATSADADVFDMGDGRASLEFVTVGNPGNVGDVQTQGTFGAVNHMYQIGKYARLWDLARLHGNYVAISHAPGVTCLTRAILN